MTKTYRNGTQRSIYLHAVKKAVRLANGMPLSLANENTDRFVEEVKFFTLAVSEATESWSEMYKASAPEVENHINAYSAYPFFDNDEDLLIDKRLDFTAAIRNVLCYVKIAQRLFGNEKLGDAFYGYGIKQYTMCEFLSRFCGGV